MDREVAIKRIKTGLQKRSGKSWSVTGGRGTAWGWLRIQTPPARRIYDLEGNLLPEGKREYGYMSLAEREELAHLLGKERPIHPQGENIPAGGDYWDEYIDRAEGRTPSRYGQQYWD